jgi:hypothetical protein
LTRSTGPQALILGLPSGLITVAQPRIFGHVPAMCEAGGSQLPPCRGSVHVDDEFRTDP